MAYAALLYIGLIPLLVAAGNEFHCPASSHPAPVTSGVPQITVLGPLLFLLYVNDIANDISSEIRLFMDDYILYRIIRTASDVSTLQADIDKLFNWSVAWQMKFNTAKCHILSITRQRNKVKPTYTLNSDTLTNVDSYPYLGVTITADLRWREHVQLAASKATCTLNFVRCNILSCTPECKSLAYTSGSPLYGIRLPSMGSLPHS